MDTSYLIGKLIFASYCNLFCTLLIKIECTIDMEGHCHQPSCKKDRERQNKTDSKKVVQPQRDGYPKQASYNLPKLQDRCIFTSEGFCIR